MGSLMEEEYRTIEEYPNYCVSNLGNVWNNKDGNAVVGFPNIDGYLVLTLYNEYGKKTKRINRLVANAFIENPYNKPIVDHINCNRKDNTLVNLRYATYTESKQNIKIPSNNKSGVKGVSFHKSTGKWRAYISIDGIQVVLGYFKSIEEATQARVKKANEVFGVYTHSCEKL
jgi:hypothetical protein